MAPVNTATPIDQIRDATGSLRRQIEHHPLYTEIQSVGDLRIFMELHVYAVWDFMSLLKSLQNSLTCVSAPWVPTRFPKASRLINEIVLGEESDTYKNSVISHFELYLEAMREARADTRPVLRLISNLRDGATLSEALAGSGIPDEARAFIQATFAEIQPDKPHITASAFTFGREDLIPAMFREMVRDLRGDCAGLNTFEYYLDRHIEVDGDSHGPLALEMLEHLCESDPRRWQEAEAAAKRALQARVRLWDAIFDQITESRNSPHTASFK